MSPILVESADYSICITFLTSHMRFSQLIKCHLHLISCDESFCQPVHLIVRSSLGPLSSVTGADSGTHQCLCLPHTVFLPYLFNDHLCVECTAEGSSEDLQCLNCHACHHSYLPVDNLVNARPPIKIISQDCIKGEEGILELEIGQTQVAILVIAIHEKSSVC